MVRPVPGRPAVRRGHGRRPGHPGHHEDLGGSPGSSAPLALSGWSIPHTYCAVATVFRAAGPPAPWMDTAGAGALSGAVGYARLRNVR